MACILIFVRASFLDVIFFSNTVLKCAIFVVQVLLFLFGGHGIILIFLSLRLGFFVLVYLRLTFFWLLYFFVSFCHFSVLLFFFMLLCHVRVFLLLLLLLVFVLNVISA